MLSLQLHYVYETWLQSARIGSSVNQIELHQLNSNQRRINYTNSQRVTGKAETKQHEQGITTTQLEMEKGWT
jgi:hypothetical protein